MDFAENVQNIYSLLHHSDKVHDKPQPSKPLLPVFLNGSSFTTHAHDSNKSPIQLQDADIPYNASYIICSPAYLQVSFLSLPPTDFGRTYLIEMDLPTTGPPVSTKPYTIPLKYKSFVDDKIKLLEDASCISKSLNDGVSPICIVKKKPDPSQPNKPQLHMCIHYRKVNQSLVTTHDNSNGKVVSTFPLPKIQELLG